MLPIFFGPYCLAIQLSLPIHGLVYFIWRNLSWPMWLINVRRFPQEMEVNHKFKIVNLN